MAENTTPIKGSATLNTRPWRAGLNQIRRDTRTFRSRLSTEFTRIDKSVKAPTDQVKKLGIGIKDLGRITSGIVISQVFYRGLNAVRAMRDEVIKFTFDMERLEQSFTRMFGDRTHAKVMIDLISDLAAKTDLSISGALNQARSLQAMGFEAEYVHDILTVLNDQIAFMGGDLVQMDRITYALGQIRNSAKLGGHEVKQLVNAFVPTGRYLKEAFPSITDDQLKDVASIGIGGEAAVKAFIEGMRRDTEGMARILAQTSRGLINNVREQSLLVSNRLVEGLRDGWRRAVLKPLSDFFEKVGDVARVGGIGGVIDTFFSPKNAKNIRLIAAGLYQGVRALVRWGSAAKPVAKTLLELSGSILAVAIPAINNLSYWLGTATQFIMNTLPPVRWLAVALGGLLIANAVSKAFLFLWGVLRLGTVLYTVTTAVLKLYAGLKITITAIRGLAIATAAANTTLVIAASKFSFLAGAALLVIVAFKPLIKKLWEFIASSRLAAIVANELADIMRKLGFVDISNIFLDDSANKDMEAYNAAVERLTQRLAALSDEERRLGQEAEKAGRRILASFDEVFEIPNQKDDALVVDASGALDAMEEMKKIMEDLFPEDKDIEIVPPVGGWEGWKKWALGLGSVLGAWMSRRLVKRILVALAGRFGGKKPPDDPGSGGSGDGKPREAEGGEGTYWDPSIEGILAENKEKEKAYGQGLDGVWRKTKEGWAQINQEVQYALAMQIIDVIMASHRIRDSIGRAYNTAANAVTLELARIREALRAIPVEHVITIGLMAAGVLATLILIKLGVLAIPVAAAIKVSVIAAAGLLGYLTDVAKAAKSIPSTANVKVNVDATEANRTLKDVKDALEKLSGWKMPSTAPNLIPTPGPNLEPSPGTTVSDMLKEHSDYFWRPSEPVSSGEVSDFLKQQTAYFSQLGVTNVPAGADPDTFASKQLTNFVEGFKALTNSAERAEAFRVIDEVGTTFDKVMARVYALTAAAAGTAAAVGTGIAVAPAAPAAGAAGAGGTSAWLLKLLKSLKGIEAIPGFKRGGIVTRDSLFRAGEGNKKEAIVPLERTGIISEFARSIAEEMGLGQQKVSHYNIGTLIADDRSLTEFERRLHAIRIDEDTRTGGA